MSLPSVTNESLIQQFKYWHQGIRQGMQYNNELYMLWQSYSAQERLTAYAEAYKHTEAGAIVCITVTGKKYCVWLSLRSPSATTEADFVLP